MKISIFTQFTIATAIALAASKATIEAANRLPIHGMGTAILDGRIDSQEWSRAAQIPFQARVPASDGGGTTPATLFAMNDGVNLYLGLRLKRSSFGGAVNPVFEFDADNDGLIEVGDNNFGSSVGLFSTVELRDGYRTSSPPCPADAICGFLDFDDGGSNDGRAEATSNGEHLEYEIEYPLNSGDTHDFALRPGDRISFVLYLRLFGLVPGDQSYADTALPLGTTQPWLIMDEAQIPRISVAVEAAGIEDQHAGPIDVLLQDKGTPLENLVVEVSSSNPELIRPSNITLQGNGAIRQFFAQPEPNASGRTRVTLTVKDHDGLSSSSEVEIAFAPANDPPQFVIGSDATARHNQGPVTIPHWITQIVAGPLDESNQTVVTHVETDAPDLFSERPSVSSDGTLRFTPAPGQRGIATLSVWAEDNGGTASGGTNRSARQTVTITIIGPNIPPTISAIADQTVLSPDALSAVTIQVSDPDSAASQFAFEAVSDNQDLAPDGKFSFQGSGGQRTMIIGVNKGRVGSARVTVSVSDGEATASQSFTITIIGTPPSVSAIADQQVSVGSIFQASFTVADVDSDLDSLILTADSDNLDVLQPSDIALGGSGAQRTLSLTRAPQRTGSALVTISVRDGPHAASTSFRLTVVPANQAPVISELHDQAIDEDQVTPPIRFTIFDSQSPAESLSVSVTSDNADLLPPEGIAAGGTSLERTLVLRPLSDRHGIAKVEVLVSDGKLTATNSFRLTVKPVNDPPVIEFPSGGPIRLNGEKTTIPFTVSDVDDEVESLNIELAVGGSAILNLSDFSITGSGRSRELVINHPKPEGGPASLLVSLSDAQGALAFRILRFEKADRTPVQLIPRIANGTFSIRWNTSVGRRYQLQWKPNLTDRWSDLGEPLEALQTPMEFNLPASQSPSRFYRALNVE